MNNGTLVQYLVIERVICFDMLRLQELKQEQEFGICKYTRSRSRSLLSLSRSGVGVSKNRLRSPLLCSKVRITSYKLRGQEWSRDNGAKNVSKKTIACLSFIMQKRLKVLEKRS